MKCGLGQSALPTVKIPFAGEKAIAERAAGAAQRWAFHEAFILGDEHIANSVRMIEEEKVSLCRTEVDAVAVLAVHVLKILKTIEVPPQKDVAGKSVARTRRAPTAGAGNG
jgi:hypothetical protein